MYSVTRSTALQRFLYGNAGFGKLSAIDGLDDEQWRFDVRFLPLGGGGTLRIAPGPITLHTTPLTNNDGSPPLFPSQIHLLLHHHPPLSQLYSPHHNPLTRQAASPRLQTTARSTPPAPPRPSTSSRLCSHSSGATSLRPPSTPAPGSTSTSTRSAPPPAPPPSAMPPVNHSVPSMASPLVSRPILPSRATSVPWACGPNLASPSSLVRKKNLPGRYASSRKPAPSWSAR